MSTTTVEPTPPGGPSSRRWWLPVLLALIIIAILAIAFFATHPHVFGGTATATPTATSTPPPPTGTPKPGPTGTPKPGPTGTPGPGPTGTPKPAPTASVTTGQISHPQSQLLAIQRGANQKKPQDVMYLNPFSVVQNNLSAYRFNGTFRIISPPQPPSPTPTAYTNAIGKPEVKMAVSYLGKTYNIFLNQPVQTGPTGIWVIVAIRPV